MVGPATVCGGHSQEGPLFSRMEIAQMDVAKAKRGLIGRNMFVGLVGTMVISVGSLFSGGCANQKDDQIAQLNSEIAALKEEKAQSEQARVAAEARAQEAETKRTQTQGNGNQPIGYDDTGR